MPEVRTTIPRLTLHPTPPDTDGTAGVLFCPECRARGWGGQARIGNRRDVCGTCNRWARRVDRKLTKMIAQLHPEEWTAAVARAEVDLYPQLIEDWCSAIEQTTPLHPAPGDRSG